MGNSGMIAGAFSSVSGKADTVLTTKGDLATYSTTRIREGVGTNNQVLTADSAQASGIKWATPSSTLWSALADYEATSAESSHTFSFTAVDFDDDSYLVLELDGGVTLGTVALDLTIENNTTASYHGSGRRLKQGAETIFDIASASAFPIGSANLFNAVNEGFFGIVQIGLHKAGSQDRPQIMSNVSCGAQRASEFIFGNLASSTSSISRIDVSTASSSWQIGTRMTLYKVARA